MRELNEHGIQYEIKTENNNNEHKARKIKPRTHKIMSTNTKKASLRKWKLNGKENKEKRNKP